MAVVHVAVLPKTDDPLRGISADQIAAREIGADARVPVVGAVHRSEGRQRRCLQSDIRLRYGLDDLVPHGSAAAAMEHNPRKLFYRLFGQGDTAAEREAITAQTGSLLDLVSEEASSLRGQLGPADQARMAEYLDSVREIERQAQKMADQDFSKLDLPDAPAGVPAEFDEHINLMFDLAALAYRAGLTRIVSMMMAAEISMLTYNQVGVSEAFHPLSHHQNNADKLTRLAVVQTYHSTVFARFLDKLRSTPDGDGSLP